MKISLLINMKMPTIVGIFIFISRENFTLSWVEHEKSFITSGPDLPANLESLARANKFNSVYAFCYQTANATNNLYWCAGWSRNSLFVFKPGFYIHVRQSNTSWIIKIYNMNWLQHEKKKKCHHVCESQRPRLASASVQSTEGSLCSTIYFTIINSLLVDNVGPDLCTLTRAFVVRMYVG